jgi:hypothetical protein
VRQRYIRLRCLTTRHQWDASETAAEAYLAAGGCEIVRPAIPRSRPLPMKANRDLARLSKPRPQHRKEPS